MQRVTAQTAQCLKTLGQQTHFSAIVEIKNKPFHVAKNDVIVAPRIKDLAIGDVISLDRTREINTPDWTLRGHPYILPDYYTIQAVVIEHAQSRDILRHFKKRSGNDKHTIHHTNHTLLRISDIMIHDLPAKE